MKLSMFNINQSINHHLKTGFIEITEERLAREIAENSSVSPLHLKSEETGPPE